MDVGGLVAGDMFGGVDAFVRSLVRQPGRAGAVADGVKALDVGLAVAVDLDVAAVHFQTQFFQADAVGVGGDADGGDADLGLHGLGLAVDLNGDLHALGVLAHLGDLGAQLELHAALFERLLSGLRDLFVLDRHDAIHGLDHGHVTAQSAIEAAELDADGARTDHDDRLGHEFRRHGLAIGPNAIAIGFQSDLRQGTRTGADGQHHRLGLQGARSARFQSDHNLGRGGALLQLGRPLDHLDFVFLHQEADALIQLFGHAARALDDGVEVERRAGRRQAVLLQVAQALELLARLQQGLGRDAAPVQADPAQVLALDNSDLQAQLAGANGRDITAGARADDDEIEFSSH